MTCVRDDRALGDHEANDAELERSVKDGAWFALKVGGVMVMSLFIGIGVEFMAVLGLAVIGVSIPSGIITGVVGGITAILSGIRAVEVDY